jgi:transposase
LTASERLRPDVVAARRAWQRRRRAVAAARFGFLDESGAKTNMTRRTGWSLKGTRLAASAPSGHWHTTTMVAAVAADGVRAAFAYPGATDGAAFRTFCRAVLAPTLKRGDVVVLDNLNAHRDQEALAALRESGAEVWPLPPYSPDLNPIEMTWSKVKAGLRRAAARNYRALTRGLGRVLATVTVADCLNAIRHCGYTQGI